MITGFHSLVYSTDADATRAFFRDVLEWPFVDSGGGWLIFQTPPSELGVHPRAEADDASTAHHELSLMCDDIHATVDDLASKGVRTVDEVTDEGFGLVVHIDVPGAGTMQLYEPRHKIAHSLERRSG